MCSFPTPLAAVWWCLEVQKLLLDEPWPQEILGSEDGRPVYDDDGRLVARGLSVRMGIHSGMPLCEPDLITHRMDYFGVMVSRAARIMSNALGGQIMCSMDIIHDIKVQVLETQQETDPSRILNPLAVEHIRRIGVEMVEIGDVKLKGIELAETLVAIYPGGLEGRFGLKDEPAPPVRETSDGDLTASKALEIGMIVLRMEAVARGRHFRPLLDRKASTQSNSATEEPVVDPRIFIADPKHLLPPINETMSEDELCVVVGGLIGRLNNALLAIYDFYNLSTQRTPALTDSPAPPDCASATKSPADILAALLRDGIIDQAILSKYCTTSPTPPS
jgi:adenylate cyclase